MKQDAYNSQSQKYEVEENYKIKWILFYLLQLKIVGIENELNELTVTL